MRPHLVLLGFGLLLAGCSSFQAGRPLDQVPLPVPAAQRLEVWSKGERFQLHAVTADADSLRGVRWWHSADCDSCRVAIARAEVDSVRTSRYDSGETGALTILVVPIVLVSGLYYILSHTD